MKFPIISRSWYWLISGAVVVAVALALFFANMRLSIQFTGGMEVVVDGEIAAAEVIPALEEALADKGYVDASVNVGDKDGFDSVLLQIAVADDSEVTELTNLVQSTLEEAGSISSRDDILELSIIGPSIGDYIKRTAKQAMIIGVILMAVYILFAFAGMRAFVSPLLLAIVTILTMLFDVAIASGAYGLLMAINTSVQIDTIFIIALLTVLGYSVNDTIVIFDRIRENYLAKQEAVNKGKVAASEIFEKSLWQTMRRSIGTSVSTLLVVIAMYIFGTGILKMFAFTLGIGVIAGTYSSIFVAAPLAYILSGGFSKKGNADS